MNAQGMYASLFVPGLMFESGERDLQKVGDMLRAENARSVAFCYSEPAKAAPYTFERIAVRLDVPQLLRAVQCLEYQSCETDDWQETEAYRFLQKVRELCIEALTSGERNLEWGAPDVIDTGRGLRYASRLGEDRSVSLMSLIQ